MVRLAFRDSFRDGKKKPLAIAVCSIAVLLILLFLGNLSYLYGSLFKSSCRVHNINVLAVDFYRGIIGQSLSAVYQQLQGDESPTLQFHSTTEYPTIIDARNAICRGDLWAAAVTQAPHIAFLQRWPGDPLLPIIIQRRGDIHLERSKLSRRATR